MKGDRWLLAMAIGSVAGGCAGVPPGPDVILITVDTLRADRLGYMGYEGASTPRIDRLAAEGTAFTQAITTMPRTTPAVASLMTGLWPHHHGSREVGQPMGSYPTLAAVLAARGYETLAVSGNGVAGPAQGLSDGFRRFVTRDEIARRYGTMLARGFHSMPSGIGPAEAVTEQAVRLVRAVDADTPVFLWVLYMDPHLPYWTRHSRPETAPACWELYSRWTVNRADMGAVMADVDRQATAALPDCSRLYDEEIAFTDAAIGRLLDELAALRRLDEAIVVFTADHGENLGEWGLFFEHGDNVHDAAVRVPLVFRGPAIGSGREDPGPASLVDVAPTLLSLAGIPDRSRPAMDGADLSDSLGPVAPEIERGPRFAESATAMWAGAVRHVTSGTTQSRACVNGPRFSLCTEGSDSAAPLALFDHLADPRLLYNVAEQFPDAVEELTSAWEVWPPGSARYLIARTPDYKLLLSPRLQGGYSEALFDLRDDVSEAVDVARAAPEVVASLRDALDRWRADLMIPMVYGPDPAVERSLRALGYIR